jgi:hypothetical protein
MEVEVPFLQPPGQKYFRGQTHAKSDLGAEVEVC